MALKHLLSAGIVLSAFVTFDASAFVGGRVRAQLNFPAKPGSRGYRLADPLGMTFDKPVCIAFPGSSPASILVGELDGRLALVKDRANPSREVLLDVTATTATGPNEGLLSVTLHPQFATNGRVFIFRTARNAEVADESKYVQISEVRLDPATLGLVSPVETVLIRQPYHSRDHLGGDLEFGPNGYLYACIGDGFAPEVNSQQIDGDYFSAVLRLDVDQRPGSLAPNPHPSIVGGFRIPPDNPYVGSTEFLGKPVDPAKVRTSFWSVGLREPFRLAFDQLTGELWVADVGAETYESVFVTSAAANHGWPHLEGPGPGPLPERVPADFSSNPEYRYSPPVVFYNHTIGACVIGGVVYRGNRFPELYGKFLFAELGWGWLAAADRKPDGSGYYDLLPLFQQAVSDFAVDAEGEVWISELSKSRLLRLESTGTFSGDPVPETLAETGAFSDLDRLTPAPGVVPYEINHPFWSDNAVKRRWFSVPEVTKHLGFDASGNWTAPAGTVWIKHFDIEMTNGVPESARRLETRFIVRQDDGVYGLTYRWNSATNAVLVPAEGMDEDLARVIDGKPVTQRWHYPSRSECLACHGQQGGFALGFGTAQLNRDIAWGAAQTNQITALTLAGYLTNAPASPQTLPRYAAIDDEHASLEWRARSYLSANCSFCHQPAGAGRAKFDARFQTSTPDAGLIGGELVQNLGDSDNRVIAPGDLAHSVLWQRASARGPRQMPPLASNEADQRGLSLLGRWIDELGQQVQPEPQIDLQAEVSQGRLRLAFEQPANRAMTVEQCRDLDSGEWLPVAIPELPATYPAEPAARELFLPAPTGTSFYRIRSESP